MDMRRQGDEVRRVDTGFGATEMVDVVSLWDASIGGGVGDAMQGWLNEVRPPIFADEPTWSDQANIFVRR